MSWLQRVYEGSLDAGVRAQATKRFQEIDQDHSGTITYDELCVAFTTPTYRFPAAAAKCLVRSVNPQGFLDLQGFFYVDRFVANCNRIFNATDVGHTRRLNAQQVQLALTQLGLDVNEQSARALVSNFDNSRVGALEYSGFLAVASLCCLNKSLLEKFDPLRRGVVSLGFNELNTLSLWYI